MAIHGQLVHNEVQIKSCRLSICFDVGKAGAAQVCRTHDIITVWVQPLLVLLITPVLFLVEKSAVKWSSGDFIIIRNFYQATLMLQCDYNIVWTPTAFE